PPGVAAQLKLVAAVISRDKKIPARLWLDRLDDQAVFSGRHGNRPGNLVTERNVCDFFVFREFDVRRVEIVGVEGNHGVRVIGQSADTRVHRARWRHLTDLLSDGQAGQQDKECEKRESRHLGLSLKGLLVSAIAGDNKTERVYLTVLEFQRLIR